MTDCWTNAAWFQFATEHNVFFLCCFWEKKMVLNITMKRGLPPFGFCKLISQSCDYADDIDVLISNTQIQGSGLRFSINVSNSTSPTPVNSKLSRTVSKIFRPSIFSFNSCTLCSVAFSSCLHMISQRAISTRKFGRCWYSLLVDSSGTLSNS